MLRFAPLILLCCAAWAGAPQFRLRDVQGGIHTSAEWTGRRAIVLFFVTTDCPVGNSYVPEMNRIHDAYAGRGVAVYAVHADPGVAEAEVARYAGEYRYGFPLLLDPDQVLVRHVNATVTPQAAKASAASSSSVSGRGGCGLLYWNGPAGIFMPRPTRRERRLTFWTVVRCGAMSIGPPTWDT